MGFYLWGTGVYAKRIQIFLHKFYEVFPQFENDFFDLKGVLDKSPSKQGEIFEKCIIKSPTSVDWKNFTDSVIVALKFPEEVVDELRGKDISSEQIYLISDFFEWFCLKAYWRIRKEATENFSLLSPKQHQYYETLEFAYYIIDFCKKKQYVELRDFLKLTKGRLSLAAGILDLYLGTVATKNFYQVFGEKKSQNAVEIKKIGVYYARYYNGGIERVMSFQIPSLISLGYKVVLFLDERDAIKEYPIPPEVECVTLGKKDLGVLQWYRRFCKAFAEHKIDVFYSHAYLTDVPMLPWVVHSYGARLYTQIHTTFSALLNSNFESMKTLYKQADRIAVLSRVDALFWQTLGINGKYLLNPVESVEPQMCKRLENTVLWCGRIEQYSKQVLDIVPIISLVKRQIPNIRLILVGGTDQPRVLEKLRLLIQENELTDNIILKGYVDNVSYYYQLAKVCIMTSRFEGFPMVLGEAISYGTPVVMYDLPYLEMVRQCKEIECVPMRDVNLMANKIMWLLKDEQAWGEHSEGVLNEIIHFRENNNYKKLLNDFLNDSDSLCEKKYSIEDYNILVLTMLNCKINPISWEYAF